MAYRYLGNKARMADAIVETVRDLVPRPASVADPMCGTATVSAAFAEEGYDVIAADELTFAVTHARVRLLIGKEPRFAALGGYDRALLRLNDADPVEGFFFVEYSDEGAPRNGSKPRRYFTGQNARRIDAIRSMLRDWREEGSVTRRESDLLTHDLILAVNRVANIAGTYGYYRSSWNTASLQTLRLGRSTFSTAPRRRHSIYQGKVEELIAEVTSDVVYLDPPYTKRQYAGNYHILETIAVGDEFDPVGEGGLRDWYGQYSAFCSRRLAADAFRLVLSQVQAQWVVVSYSEDGVVEASQLQELLADYGSVSRKAFALPRFRSNGGRTAAVTEYLYCVKLS